MYNAASNTQNTRIDIFYSNELLNYRIFTKDDIYPTQSGFSIHVPKSSLEGIKQQIYSILKSEHNIESLKKIGAVLYAQVVPVELSKFLQEKNHIVTVTAEDHAVPWELVYDGEEFWGVRYSIGRVLLSKNITEKVSSNRRTKKGCLIISNPTGDLEHAEMEAQSLIRFLRSKNIQCTYIARSEATSFNILMELNSNRFDFIHYSGHIVKDSTGKHVMLLANHEKFSMDTIHQLDMQNSLVYLNGCTSGNINLDGEAGSVNQEIKSVVLPFIKSGATGVVGSLWKISDNGARNFAEAFYEYILSGYTVGESMAKTRNRFKDSNDNTWAAYVLFGNPNQIYSKDEFPREVKKVKQKKDGFLSRFNVAAMFVAAGIFIVISAFIANGGFGTNKADYTDAVARTTTPVPRITTGHIIAAHVTSTPNNQSRNEAVLEKNTLYTDHPADTDNRVTYNPVTYSPGISATPVFETKSTISNPNNVTSKNTPVPLSDGSMVVSSNLNSQKAEHAVARFKSGQFEIHGKWIFFMNADDNNCIYKMSTDGKGLIKVTDASSINFVILGDWIYYSTDEGIYKSPVNGKNIKVLVNRDRFNVSTADSNTLYYSSDADDDNIYMYREDSMATIKFGDIHPGSMSVRNSWLIYTDVHDGNKLYRMNIDSKEKVLLNTSSTECFKVSENYIYYVDDGGIHRKLFNGTNQTDISKDVPTSIDVYGSWIYYNYGQDGYGLYKIKTDGTGKRILHKGKAGQIVALDDGVLYLNGDDGFKIYNYTEPK